MSPPALFLVLAIFPAAPALKPAPAHPIVGEWVATRFVVGGHADATPGALRYRFTATGGWAVLRDGRKVGSPDKSYNLDPKAGSPALDLVHDPAAGAEGKFLAIYRLAGDRLTVCLATETQPRPTAFESAARSSVTLIEFRRVKEGE
jgi:uncharacterized protein (TIGR03067 family)